MKEPAGNESDKTLDSSVMEKDGELSSQEESRAEQDAAINLSKSSFVLVLVGLVLAVFLVWVHPIVTRVNEIILTSRIGLARFCMMRIHLLSTLVRMY